MKIERPPCFLRLPAVQQRIPFSKSSIYLFIADGKFPKPHRLSSRAVGWLESEIDLWCEARATSEPDVPAAPRPPLRTRRK
jgi:prophage regulatory protein